MQRQQTNNTRLVSVQLISHFMTDAFLNMFTGSLEEYNTSFSTFHNYGISLLWGGFSHDKEEERDK